MLHWLSIGCLAWAELCKTHDLELGLGHFNLFQIVGELGLTDFGWVSGVSGGHSSLAGVGAGGELSKNNLMFLP